MGALAFFLPSLKSIDLKDIDMKKILFLTLLFSLFASSLCLAETNDKAKHFAYSAAFGLIADTIAFHEIEQLDTTQRLLVSTGVALVPGIIKETVDDEFDMDDMLANAIGAAAGSLLGETAFGYASVSANGDQFFVEFHREF